jgi:ABC-2 type transport system permease protein
MKLKRILALMAKDLFHGSRSLIFVFAVVIPLVASLVISLLLGTLFEGKPRLGLADPGGSALAGELAQLDYLTTRSYKDATALRRDVERGALDMGIVLPAGVDQALAEGRVAALDVYVWGESLIKDRTVLAAALARQVMALSGGGPPVEVITTLLGDGRAITWAERLFPLIVIMTIVLGGTMAPATSLVQEKQARTLTALTITPASYGEVLIAKAAVGALVTTIMGVAILALNRAFGVQPVLMVGLVALSALLAAEFGVILGTLVGDISTLFTVVKGLGILLYAPAIFYLFPELPGWLARLFPTYYMLGPIVEVSMSGAGWGEIRGDVAILCGLIVAGGVAAGLIARRTMQRA